MSSSISTEQNKPRYYGAAEGTVNGFSCGGKYALSGTCLQDKDAHAVWVDPGPVFNEQDLNADQ